MHAALHQTISTYPLLTAALVAGAGVGAALLLLTIIGIAIVAVAAKKTTRRRDARQALWSLTEILRVVVDLVRALRKP